MKNVQHFKIIEFPGQKKEQYPCFHFQQSMATTSYSSVWMLKISMSWWAICWMAWRNGHVMS